MTQGFYVMDSDFMGTITNGELAIEIKNLSVQLSDLKVTLAQNASSYVNSEVFDLRMKELDTRIDIIKAELRQFSRAKWVQNTLSAVLGAALSLLIAYFISNIGKH